MIYHLLPEWEDLSTIRGGAVANIAANMMTLDPDISVVCGYADGTWNFPQDRVLVLPQFHSYHRRYARVKGKRFLFNPVYAPLLRWIFRPLLSRLKPGDVVWCHSQVFVFGSLERHI